MKMTNILMAIALVGGCLTIGQSVQAVSKFSAKSIDVFNHSLKHPESMPKGYIGGGKVITGHDAFGNPIMEGCSPEGWPKC